MVLGFFAGSAMSHLMPPIGAAAGDHKIFAPQFCIPRDLDSAFYTVDAVEELGEDFFCPLVRDVVSGTLDDVWIRLDEEDGNENDPPTCCVHSVSMWGGSEDFECRTAPAIDTSLSLHFPLDDFSEYDYGHYTVTCSLGTEDAIHSIRTNEG